jgi:acetyl esterase/lipase
MRRLILFLLALALLPIFRMPASAQMSNMPEDLRARLAEINPTWGKDILGNVATTLALYTPILAAAPKDGVRIERDLAYGPDALHRLDLHKQEGRTGMPIVVFLHGGAYVRGSRSVNTEVYGNVATYFARQGMLGVNGTYRLAPAAQWPAAAQDVGLLVKWLKANASAHGGDPERIYLIGHSAGATHIATYLYHSDLQEPNGAGIAGVVLMSGRYYFAPKPDDPNLTNFQAYFGTDQTRYPRSRPSIMSRRRNRCRPSSSSQSTTTQTLTRKALCCLAPYANGTAHARASRVWSCTITFRWSTNSIQLTMHWAAKSWNSSGAVGDLRSRPSWLKVICREAPRLAPIIRPPAGDEGVCLLSSTAMSDLQTALRTRLPASGTVTF